MPRLASRLLLPWLALWAAAVAVAPPLVREDLRQFAQPAAASAVDPAARQLVLQGAAAGLPESLYVLAMMKLYGHGEPRDAPAAVRLLQRAADLRHRDAQFALGVLFGAGDGGSAAWSCGMPPHPLTGRAERSQACRETTAVAPRGWPPAPAPATATPSGCSPCTRRCPCLALSSTTR